MLSAIKILRGYHKARQPPTRPAHGRTKQAAGPPGGFKMVRGLPASGRLNAFFTAGCRGFDSRLPPPAPPRIRRYHACKARAAGGWPSAFEAGCERAVRLLAHELGSQLAELELLAHRKKPGLLVRDSWVRIPRPSRAAAKIRIPRLVRGRGISALGSARPPSAVPSVIRSEPAKPRNRSSRSP